MRTVARPAFAANPTVLSHPVQRALRARRASIAMERTYSDWIARFHRFSGSPDPASLGPAEVQRFLAHLSGNLRLSPATQREALNALEFLYRDVLQRDAG